MVARLTTRALALVLTVAAAAACQSPADPLAGEVAAQADRIKVQALTFARTTNRSLSSNAGLLADWEVRVRAYEAQADGAVADQRIALARNPVEVMKELDALAAVQAADTRSALALRRSLAAEIAGGNFRVAFDPVPFEEITKAMTALKERSLLKNRARDAWEFGKDVADGL
ncbi:MAG: hypothetical protein AB7O45_03135, partial [Alphaproteobacteria bacterium]